MARSEIEEQPHVAVIAFPLATHAAPLLALAEKLAAAIPASTFSFFNTAKSNASIATAIQSAEALGNLRLHEVWDGVPEGYVFQGKHQEEIELFLNAASGALRKAVEGSGEPRVTCVVSDTFMWCAGELAAELHVPWISLWTSGTAALLAHLHTHRIRRMFGVSPNEIEARLDERLDSVPGLNDCLVRDLPEGIVFGKLDSAFSRMLVQMGEASPRSDVLVINSFEALDAAILDHLSTIYRKFLHVGPLSLLAPPPAQLDLHGCLPFLDGGLSPVVYVSFGSVKVLSSSELATLAEGLQDSGFPFLWSLNGAQHAQLPVGFLEGTKERGLVVPWAPQTRVLAHPAVGAFVTHCGWNSVLESVTAGVPMICRPWFGDQRLNTRLVSTTLKVGVGLDSRTFTRDGVVRALKLVLAHDEGKKMKERAQSLKEIAKTTISNGGSSVGNFHKLVQIISTGWKGC